MKLLGNIKVPDLNLKNLISYKTMVYISLWLLGLIGASSLLLDSWVFYYYGYRIVNSEGTSEYTVSVKTKELKQMIDLLDEKEDRFNSILSQGIDNLPPAFK